MIYVFHTNFDPTMYVSEILAEIDTKVQIGPFGP